MSLQQRATLDDVARLAGVSRKTVSRVYSEPEKVAGTTRDQVLAAARRLRFRPNTLARTLRRGGTSSTVGLLIGDMSNPFYHSVAAGIERELSSAGLTLVLGSSDDSEEGEERVADALLSQRVAALMMIPAAADQSYLDGERQLGTPVIAVDRPAKNLLADAVLLQNRSGARQATEALLAQGHRQIAYLASPADIYTQRERLAGYRGAMTEAGLGRTGPLEHLSDDADEDAVARAALGSAEPPTAVLAGNNRMSVAVLRAARELQVSPALIGFDDFDTADVLGISVISHDPLEMGRRAAALAVERIARPATVPEVVELPTRLVLRGSERPEGVSL
ncbi:LacI family DNA-binding transcriptional regulator [Nesterenkonia xinjiangensis]|uniref:LacI family transcriptional regulator n=1 Tax=Nesterenkonia xinjiangensis TaxID=225327 RepID=A0A7Z0GLL2_9MICC|nr:LacI family DNA-binding transcriptional regulator [Nesterenkonia xinjiangensis]NYJ77098.1 LacI family transcriptional regulator [Nesterenkonia xinjiangensis]